MAEASKQWEGQIVAGAYALRQYLGESDHSAVFLTEYGEGEPQKAAIKLVPADPATAELQLSNWKLAAELSHPNLLRLFRTGRCSLDGNDLLFLVMELAEENLSEVLPQRALTSEETRDMLCPVLDALEYLHGKGLVHGDLKPANILASGDNLKLSSDTISRIGKPPAVARKAGACDPPESTNGVLTAATDVWSLGLTLVEVMTQRLPDWQPGLQTEPLIPATMAAPFQEIARQCLRLEPQRRISIADIAARLNSRAIAATASASVLVSSPGAAPAAGQVSPATPKPVASLPVPPRAAARLQTNPHRPPPYRASSTRSRFIIPLTIGALAFAAIVTVPRLLTHRPGSQATPPVAAEKRSGQPATERRSKSGVSSNPRVTPELEPEVSETARTSAPATQQATKRAAQPIVPSAVKTTREKETPSPEPALNTTPVSEGAAKPATMGRVSAKGEVLDQVLPEVSQKARDTIRGRVRVGIKVHVDPAGAVSNAELDSPGPSKYFAELALQAARKWAFTPPEVGGKSVASEWSLYFVFSQNDTKVTPTQTAP
ncbi:MAG TPA: TonB family protein [Candidatus Acidoferrum sp.]|nr:TonB family protein [Candidatus Acidoferrum sp.]